MKKYNRNITNLPNIPMSDIPKVVSDWVNNEFLPVINRYRESPWLIRKDITDLFYKARYNYFLLTDPPPRQKRKELTSDYFERIDPKYGLRFYQTLVGLGTNIDLSYSLSQVDERYKDKKSRKVLKDFLIALAEIEQNNLEQYNRYKMRVEILKDF